MKEVLLSWLNSQVGYHEGANNYNKYAPDVVQAIGWNAQNQPWCAIFVVCAFVICFGVEQGCRMLRGCIGGISAACRQNYERFRCAGQLCTEPQTGDVVYFTVGGEVNHEGIVVNVTEKTIDTIEGNSGDSVKRNTYYRTDCSIAGYGRPEWSEDCRQKTPAESNQPTQARPISTVPVMVSQLPLLKDYLVNEEREDVKALQTLLNLRGADLKVDGHYGKDTKDALLEFQRKFSLEEDGECGREAWQTLITMKRG